MNKPLLFSLFISAIMLSSMQTSASASSELTNSPEVLRPNASLFDSIKNPIEFLRMLNSLESANFTDDTVYFSSTSFSNTYEIPLQSSETLRIRFDPEEARNRLLLIINHLEDINSTILIPAWDLAEDYWTNATFWSDVTIEKSTFETSIEEVNLFNFRKYFTLMTLIASAPTSMNELSPEVTLASYEEIVVTINFVENLPIDERTRYIRIELWKLFDFDPLALLWIGYDSSIIDVTNIIGYKDIKIKFTLFLKRLQLAYGGLAETDEPILITQEVVTDITKQVTVTGGRLTILYDPDRSVIESMESIRDNISLDTQPFTGDETFTFATQYHVTETIWGDISVLNPFTNNERYSIFGNLPANLEIREAINAFWMKAIGPIYSKIQTYLNPQTIQNIQRLQPVKSAWSDFEVSMMKIDNLDFAKLPNGFLTIKNLNFTYITHNAQGLYAYNDTNDNNIMDVGIRTDALSTSDYYTNTSEAVGRVIFLGFEDRTYQRPTTENDVLSFGRSVTNVNATIIPFGKSVDLAIANETSNTVHNVDEIGTNFHFSVDGTTSNLKYDYIMGDWTENEELEGLSLTHIITTTVIDLQSSKQINQIVDEDQTALDPTADTDKIRKLRFNSGTELDFEVKLDEIPYLWDGTTTETAYGMLIPLNFMNFFGSIMTTNGEMIRSFTLSIYTKRYAYAISYPIWDGKSIVHDPVFSVVSGDSEETEWTDGEDTSKTGVPGFELITLLALPIVYGYKRYENKNKLK